MRRHLHIANKMTVNVLKTLCYVRLAEQYDGHHDFIGAWRPAYPADTFNVLFDPQSPRTGGLLGFLSRLAEPYDFYHLHTHLQDINLIHEAAGLPNEIKAKLIWHCYDRPPKPNLLPDVVCIAGGPDAVPHAASPLYGMSRLSNAAWPMGMAPTPNKEMSGIVLASTLTNTPGHFRYWKPVLQEFKDSGHPVTVYTGSLSMIPEYQDVCDCRPFIHPLDLLQELANAEWTLCGSPPGHTNDLQTQAMPNKIYDALAAETPILYMNSNDQAAKWVKGYSVGIVVDAVAEAIEKMRLADLPSIQQNIRVLKASVAQQPLVEISAALYRKTLPPTPRPICNTPQESV